VKRAIAACLLFGTLLCASDASSFCGFYVGGAGAKLFNDATVVVMMREGTRTVLSMQNAYKGPPEKFAMVVPVPVVLQEENVKTLKKELFDHIDQLASPRLVEYWEQDPCAQLAHAKAGAGGARPAAAAAPMPESRAREDLGVKIEAQFTVGEYQIVILSAQDSGGLDTWLHREGYNIPAGGEPYFRPYVASGSKFFVAKVDVTKVKMENGLALLSPLRFHYDSEDFKLPVRLGLINSSGTQDLIIHILGRGTRYEVANYPNVTIPTTLDVSEVASEKFGTFYTALFDRTLEKNPKAVVTEYAWEPTSCDPCPGPAMSLGDLSTFGVDVLPSTIGQRAGGQQFVLTRLHARYTKDSLGEDLTFRAAPAIVGGREIHERENKLEQGSRPSSFNNFQARYAVRHPWAGPIECKEPRRGVWGPKPGGGYANAPPKSAQKLGLTPRAQVELGTFVKQDIPEIGFTKPAVPAGAAAGAGAGATPGSGTEGANAKRGCLGCAVTSSDASRNGAALAGFGLIVLALRRRKL
jgi:MYXO-CTERM domain-containing protein